mmetsp:Transcript_33698/g.73938  ORF Transcript_33698/g.73938 Transcript_33698/m.73938 type:complete len:219 (+) Transcript_33698:487-1143(+)
MCPSLWQKLHRLCGQSRFVCPHFLHTKQWRFIFFSSSITSLTCTSLSPYCACHASSCRAARSSSSLAAFSTWSRMNASSGSSSSTAATAVLACGPPIASSSFSRSISTCIACSFRRLSISSSSFLSASSSTSCAPLKMDATEGAADAAGAAAACCAFHASSFCLRCATASLSLASAFSGAATEGTGSCPAAAFSAFHASSRLRRCSLSSTTSSLLTGC